MNDNPFEIKEEACASSPDHRRYLLIQAVDTETGEIVWAVGDDQICAVTRADFIRTPEIRYRAMSCDVHHSKEYWMRKKRRALVESLDEELHTRDLLDPVSAAYVKPYHYDRPPGCRP